MRRIQQPRITGSAGDKPIAGGDFAVNAEYYPFLTTCAQLSIFIPRFQRSILDAKHVQFHAVVEEFHF
jgi:hypothetical protein